MIGVVRFLVAGALLTCTFFQASFGSVESPTIGTLDVDVSVSQGALSASLPFDFPSGIHDLTPSFGLHYSQQGGNGIVGPGFSLAGLASIEQCTPTINLDGYVAGLDGTLANTRFCMNGQRLVLASGTHGVSGANYVLQQNNNSRFYLQGTKDGLPYTWKQQDGNGYTFVYERVSSATGNKTNWLLTQKTDFFGNKISYQYTSELKPKISRVSYADFQINFSYRKRLKDFNLYEQGQLVKEDKLLDRVDVFNKTEYLYGYRLQYEGIKTLYSSTPLDRLVSVQRCYNDQSSNCLAPTRFSYKSIPASHYAQDSAADRTIVVDRSFYADANGQTKQYERPAFSNADLNNDGVSEFCYYKPGTGILCAEGLLNTSTGKISYSEPTRWSEDLGYQANADDYAIFSVLRFIDLNEDGYIDYCIADKKGIRCGLNNKSDRFQTAEYENSIPFNSESNIVFQAIDQDKQVDVCGFNKDEIYQCYRGTGNGFSSDQLLTTNYPKAYRKTVNWSIQYCNSVEDSSAYGACKSKKEFSESTPYFAPTWLDIDGDRNQDLCWGNEAKNFVCQMGSVNSLKEFSLSNPKVVLDNLPVSQLPESIGNVRYTDEDRTNYSRHKTLQKNIQKVIDKNIVFGLTFKITDLNSDGLADVCYEKDYRYYCRLNKGQTLENQFTPEALWFDYKNQVTKALAIEVADDGTMQTLEINKKPSQGKALHIRSTLVIQDTNADGLQDLCYTDIDDIQYCALNTTSKFDEQYARVKFATEIDYNFSEPQNVYENFVRKLFGMKTEYVYSSRTAGAGKIVQTTDMNGDGKGEQCYRGLYGIMCTSMRESAPLSLLESITDGFGVETTIQYGQLLTSGLYEQASNIPDGFIERPVDSLVVSSISTGNGVFDTTTNKEGDSEVSYRYQGQLYNPKSKVAGFQAVSLISHASNTTEEKTYYNLAKYLQGLATLKQTIIDRSVVKEERNFHSLVTASNKSYRVQLDKLETIQRDLTGAELSRTTTQYNSYDAFGNATNISVTKQQESEVLYTQTNTTFMNDQHHWLLARPLTQVAVHQLYGMELRKEVAYEYTNGLLTKETIEPTSKNKTTTTYEYDRHGNGIRKSVTGLVSESQAQTRTVTTTYDSLGRVLTKKNSIGQIETYTYDEKCLSVKTHTDIAGRKTTTAYDDLCRISEVTDPLGNKISYQRSWSTESNQQSSHPAPYWNKIVYEVSEYRPDGTFKTAYYDSHQRKVREKASGFSDKSNIRLTVSDIMYDRFGQKYAESVPYSEVNGLLNINGQHWTTYHLDKAGRIKQVDRPGADGNPQTVKYSYSGSVKKVTYPNYSKETKVNVLGKQDYVTENGLQVSYRYDALGNLTMTNAQGIVTRLYYDDLGRKIKQEDPSMGTWEYKYNAFGELIWQKDAKGQIVTNEYDQLGRQTKRTEAEGTSRWSYYTQGAGIGQVSQEISPSATRTYRYNNNGALNSSMLEVDDEVFVTNYDYDSYGRLAMVTQPNGLRQKYNYDETGQVKTVSIPREDFSEVDLDNLVAEKNALFNSMLALQLRIDALEQRAASHQAKAANYLMLATNSSNTATNLQQGRDTLLAAAAKHEEVAAVYRQAANDYYQKANTAENFAHSYFRGKGEEKKWTDFKFSHMDGEKAVFNASHCSKHKRAFGIRYRCKNRHWVDESFILSNINLVDPNNESEAVKYNIHCTDRKNCTSVKPYKVYRDVANQYDALAKTRAAAAASAKELANKTEEKIPVPINLTKQVWVPIGISPTIFVEATVNYTEYQLKNVSVEEAVAYYSKEAERYRNLADAELKTKAKVVENLDALYAELSERQTALDGLNNTLEAYGIDAYELDDAYAAVNQYKADNPDTVLWMATMRAPAGQLQTELFGNGLFSKREINPATGNIERITTGSYSGKILRDVQYRYNELGQVVDKYDNSTVNNKSDEHFIYDRQGRIIDWTFSQTVTLAEHTEDHSLSRRYSYDTRGNLEFKTGAGNMHYDLETNRLAKRTNDVNTHNYSYDNNGNMLSGDGRSYQWNSFNKVMSVTQNGTTVNFTYDASHGRVKKVVGNSVTYYAGNGYELTIITKGNEKLVTERHNIVVGNDVVTTIEKSRTEKASSTEVVSTDRDQVGYYHRDLIGSGDIVTNTDREVISRRYYSPYGESVEALLKEKENKNVLFNSPVDIELTDEYKQQIIDAIKSGEDITLFAETVLKTPQKNLKLRGFTSHEEVEGMGLVNMNARLYDPLIGRFISADSVIPDAEKSLAYNRYMYVYGNPVSYRDPDGHIGIVAVGVIAAVAFFTTAHMTDSEILQAASTIALGASLSYATAGLLNSGFIGAGLAGSFSSITVSFAKTGQLTEQSLKSAAIAGIAAAVAYGIGHGGPNGASPFENSAFFKAGMHGVTSGMRSVLEGGEFHHGLISGLAGHFSGELTGDIGGSTFHAVMGRTMVAASFGGLSSWATGGDFVQGAMIAATVHLFNEEWGNIEAKVKHWEDEKRYNELSQRLNKEAGENQNSVLLLSIEDVLIVAKHTSNRANSFSDSKFSPIHYKRYKKFDTFFFDKALVSRTFLVEGQGYFSGNNINYIGVGIYAARYNYSQNSLYSTVIGWNSVQAINLWGNRKNISGEFMRNVNEITPGGAWANWGWHYYRDHNAY